MTLSNLEDNFILHGKILFARTTTKMYEICLHTKHYVWIIRAPLTRKDNLEIPHARNSLIKEGSET